MRSLPIARIIIVATAAAGLVSGCAGQTKTTTVTEAGGETAKLKRFAFQQTERQARRVCASVPRDVLAVVFARRSSGGVRGDPLRYDDNDVALLYVEDIDISPIRLQTAAYNGCLTGLEDQADVPTRIASLRACPARGEFPHGGGWGARVRGITCEEVGRFIQYRFFATPPLSGAEGRRTVGGYRCRFDQFDFQPGYYFVACRGDHQIFTWNFTP